MCVIDKVFIRFMNKCGQNEASLLLFLSFIGVFYKSIGIFRPQRKRIMLKDIK